MDLIKYFTSISNPLPSQGKTAEDIKNILSYLNNPHQHLKNVFFVVGDCGKTSVAKLMANIMMQSSYNVNACFTNNGVIDYQGTLINSNIQPNSYWLKEANKIRYLSKEQGININNIRASVLMLLTAINGFATCSSANSINIIEISESTEWQEIFPNLTEPTLVICTTNTTDAISLTAFIKHETKIIIAPQDPGILDFIKDVHQITSKAKLEVVAEKIECLVNTSSKNQKYKLQITTGETLEFVIPIPSKVTTETMLNTLPNMPLLPKNSMETTKEWINIEINKPSIWKYQIQNIATAVLALLNADTFHQISQQAIQTGIQNNVNKTVYTDTKIINELVKGSNFYVCSPKVLTHPIASLTLSSFLQEHSKNRKILASRVFLLIDYNLPVNWILFFTNIKTLAYGIVIYNANPDNINYITTTAKSAKANAMCIDGNLNNAIALIAKNCKSICTIILFGTPNNS